MNQKNILVPELPESIHYATIVKWHKKIGDIVQQNEILIDVETEKVILEVPAKVNGKLKQILYPVGSKVKSKQIVGYIQLISVEQTVPNNTNDHYDINSNANNNIILKNDNHSVSPSIRRMIANKDTKSDLDIKKKNFEKIIPQEKQYHRVSMTPMRQRISERLLQTIKNTAMLTTFNEVNMKTVINMRNNYNINFEKQHNIKLGLMPFFVKSVSESIKRFPKINARIDKNDIIYYKYFDVNIAISTKNGLVTPILRNADHMSMIEIEKKIQYFILKSQEEKLELKDLLGGNFTITNGGIFGSLLSTPLINPPQSAILGMHAIKDRVIVINGKIKIAPMMYLSLSYDHRLIDGKEAVGFLNRIKDILEDFSRIVLNI